MNHNGYIMTYTTTITNWLLTSYIDTRHKPLCFNHVTIATHFCNASTTYQSKANCLS